MSSNYTWRSSAIVSLSNIASVLDIAVGQMAHTVQNQGFGIDTLKSSAFMFESIFG